MEQSSLSRTIKELEEDLGPQLAELASLLSAGDIRVLVDSAYQLAEARRAHERAVPEEQLPIGLR